MILDNVKGLSKGSHKRIRFKCEMCLSEHSREYRYILNSISIFNKIICKNCAAAEKFKIHPELIENRKLIRGENHPNFGKKFPEISKRMKLNNPMKNKETCEKVANWRRNMPDEIRQKYSDSQKKCWADGLFDNVRVGQCEWFDYIKKDGSIVKCQGTWELATFEWLDKNNIEYEAHHGRIPYVDDEGIERNYYPDAFLNKENKYIDVKNDYHLSLQRRKFELIFEQNSNIKIEIWTKDILLSKALIKS